MQYVIYLNGRRAGTARDLESAVSTAKLYTKFGNVLIEAPSGNISTIGELEKFIESEALFLAEW